MYNRIFLTVFSLAVLATACQKSQPIAKEYEEPATSSIFSTENIVAWCVVPFDKLERNPEERAIMLKELGITKLAYDWRDRHLPTFPEEVAALKKHGVELTSVWLWVDGQSESLLNAGNQQLLDYMDSLNLSCDIWMSFDERMFEGMDDSETLETATETITALHQLASSVGSRLQLYNHGSWFGDPHNQIRVIEKSGFTDIGIIYNFHHAHQQIEQFPELLEAMLPYLNTVNTNGMNADGPMILTVGQGESEQDMLRTLADSDFKGNVGIIGHLEDEDVKIVLERNLKGLQNVTANF